MPPRAASLPPPTALVLAACERAPVALIERRNWCPRRNESLSSATGAPRVAAVLPIALHPRGSSSRPCTRLSWTTRSAGEARMRKRSTSLGCARTSIRRTATVSWLRRCCSTCARKPSTRRARPSVRVVEEEQLRPCLNRCLIHGAHRDIRLSADRVGARQA